MAILPKHYAQFPASVPCFAV
jgi:ribosome-interacting GTPase 1